MYVVKEQRREKFHQPLTPSAAAVEKVQKGEKMTTTGRETNRWERKDTENQHPAPSLRFCQWFYCFAYILNSIRISNKVQTEWSRREVETNTTNTELQVTEPPPRDNDNVLPDTERDIISTRSSLCVGSGIYSTFSSWCCRWPRVVCNYASVIQSRDTAVRVAPRTTLPTV